jgi:GMP synthase (glutamine-hydrolysing)
MTLIANLIIDEQPRTHFDEVVFPRLAAIAGEPVETVHLADPAPLPDPAAHRRVILSGSELSAADGAPRDPELIRFIRRAAFAGSAILGICYGHQMIARALAADTACRKAAVPEFGWRRLALRPNPLFIGIDDLISAHSHFDEVVELTDDFEIIASTPDCAVQGFQQRGRPVWGVQFHPEVDHATGEEMFARNAEKDERARANLKSELTDPEELLVNERIFENFFRAAR